MNMTFYEKDLMYKIVTCMLWRTAS